MNSIVDPAAPVTNADESGYKKAGADSGATGGNSASSKLELELEPVEPSALKQLASCAPIPTSVTALHGHPVYVLERHIGKYQAICPTGEHASDEPVGELNGERVYLRRALETLHTREGWLKEARDVRVEERERPAKVVRARENAKARKRRLDASAATGLSSTPALHSPISTSTGASSTSSSSNAAGGVSVTTVLEDERPQVGLYGRWQTAPYEPPAAHHPHVPKNEFGNVYLFQPQMLPAGTVHLRLSGQRPPRVAQLLGIDIAPALVGIHTVQCTL